MSINGKYDAADAEWLWLLDSRDAVHTEWVCLESE